MATPAASKRKVPVRRSVDAAEQIENEQPVRSVPSTVDIEIAADPRKEIVVDLVGQRYLMKRPKTALLMKMAISAQNMDRDPAQMYDVMNEALHKAFGTDASEQIQARLEDPDDDLEYEHVTLLMKRLISYGTGNPSTSS